MKVEASRDELNPSLGVKLNRVLVYVGGEQSKAKALHTALEAASLEEHHVHAWVLDAAKLTPEERDAWFWGAKDDPTDCFVLLHDAAPKKVLMNGRVSDLLAADGKSLQFERIRGLFTGLRFAGGSRL